MPGTRTHRNGDPMSRRIPIISTDQVQAFVAYAQFGTLREAARQLHLSIEGLRARLLALQERIGEPLYVSTRGRSGALTLTPAGERVLRMAPMFLDAAAQMRPAVDRIAQHPRVLAFEAARLS